jgi:spore germination protein GerM
MIRWILFGMFLLVSAVAGFAQSTASMNVRVFFHNEKLNPNMEDCRKVFPATRTIPRTKSIARAALDELFKGTTEEERRNEFWSFEPSETKDIIKSLNIRNGVAYLNFKSVVFEKLGNTTTSCGGGFYSSIEKTLTQFPTIKKVIYAVEGNANEFYEWVQVGECPHGKKLCARANFQ